MTSYKITYIIAGRITETNWCIIHTCDTLNNGDRINNITGAIKFFEECAERWGTYENQNAITNIEKLKKII